jgi:hypothetical protein
LQNKFVNDALGQDISVIFTISTGRIQYKLLNILSQILDEVKIAFEKGAAPFGGE